MTRLRRATLLALTAQLFLLVIALRHHFVWGARHTFAGIELQVLLGIGEGLGLVAYTVLGALALRQALAAGSPPDHDAAARAATHRAVLRAGIFLALTATLVPPFLSSDVFDYIARGRVEAHYRENPYLTAPAALPAGDAVLALAEWPGFVMPYGPISAWAQALCAGLGGAVPWLGVYLYKLLAAAAHVATGWLLARAAPAPDATLVLAMWLFHPWLLLESCGSGHNEALVALCLAWMLERLGRDRWAWATVAFGLAVLTKHGCAPLGPLLLVAAWHARRLTRFWLGVGVVAAITALAAWRYFSTPGALAFLSSQTDNRGTSLQYFVALMLGPTVERPLLWLGYAATLGVLAAACKRLRSRADLAHHGITVMLVFVVAAMPLFSPWYHLWWAPLVALLPLAHGGAVALRALAWLGPLSYLVYACTRQLGLVHQVWAWTLACAVPAAIVWRHRATR